MTAPDVTAIRAALKAAEQTAKAATPGPWEAYGDSEPFGVSDDRANDLGFMMRSADAAFAAAFDPAFALALIAKDRGELERAVVQLGAHHDSGRRHFDAKLCARCGGMWRCPDHRRALASLTALAAVWLPHRQETTDG